MATSRKNSKSSLASSSSSSSSSPFPFDLLPSELLLKIFSFLPPLDINRCSFVSKKWKSLADDDALWLPWWKREEALARRGRRGEGGGGNNAGEAVRRLVCEGKVKEAYVLGCKKRRNAVLSKHLQSTRMFQGLPNFNKILQDLDLHWEMWVTTRSASPFANAKTFVFSAQDKRPMDFSMSSSIRFSDLELPSLSSIDSIRFIVLIPLTLPVNQSSPPLRQRACVALLTRRDLMTPPVEDGDFFGASADAALAGPNGAARGVDPKASPVFVRILQNRDPGDKDEDGNGEINAELPSTSPLSRHSPRNPYAPSCHPSFTTSSTLLATWCSRPDSLAFVSVSLHHHHLLPLALEATTMGVARRPEPFRGHDDDISSRFGLQGFDVMVEMRKQRKSLWKQRFNDVFCRKEIDPDSTHIPLTLIRPDHPEDSVNLLVDSLGFDWRTELFKGVVAGVVVVDVVVVDELKKPFIAVTSPVLFKEMAFEDLEASGYLLDMNLMSSSSSATSQRRRPASTAPRIQHGVHEILGRVKVVVDVCRVMEEVAREEEEGAKMRVVRFEVGLHKKLVNSWFGRNY